MIFELYRHKVISLIYQETHHFSVIYHIQYFRVCTFIHKHLLLIEKMRIFLTFSRSVYLKQPVIDNCNPTLTYNWLIFFNILKINLLELHTKGSLLSIQQLISLRFSFRIQNNRANYLYDRHSFILNTVRFGHTLHLHCHAHIIHT